MLTLLLVALQLQAPLASAELEPGVTVALSAEWEDPARAPEVITFRRWMAPGSAAGSRTQIWRATRTVSGEPPQSASSGECAGLADTMVKLEGLELGPALSPPTIAPPIVRLHGLYTIRSRNRGPGGEAQVVQVTTTAGPFADWAWEAINIVDACIAGASG